MKSMDSQRRNMVNQYILFLRWQMRKESEEDIEAELSADPASFLSHLNEEASDSI